jgi:V/A-type H+-transporting ATPase subunit A
MERQKYMATIVAELSEAEYRFESHEEVSPYFKKLINTLKQMNYSEFKSEPFHKYESEVKSILSERRAQ